jgi:hypothetical protein
MTVYDRLSRRPAVFWAMTGHSLAAFEQLYEQVAGAIESYEESRLNRRDRQRGIGAGSQYSHDARDRLLMALIWLRIYPTYDVLGFIFELDKSNVCRNLKPVLAVLREQVGNEIAWPDKRRRQQKMAQFLQEFPEVAAIGDATEQPIQRPQDADVQQQYYSGKKKRHTLKTQIVVGPDGEIMDISPTAPGSRHDKKHYDTSGVDKHLDEDEAMMGDSGFQGIQQTHRAVLPDKKPKGGELTPAQKTRNRAISHLRIVVENTIAQLKTFRVLYQVYRQARAAYNDTFRIVAALVNRRIQRRPLRTAAA